MAASEIEIAWLAGLLEGEGSFLALHRKRDGAIHPRISMTMTDKDIIDRVRALMGGSVTEVRRPNKKVAWSWTVQAFADAEHWLPLLYPHMGERRRQQIDVVLNARPWGTNTARSAVIEESWRSGKRSNRRKVA